ncbi:acyl-CoA dehydrogenase family protein [Streptomyces sp. NPDC002514]|uniref:acyl-CoA dehydrogenase family protein n=1 Tax=Streptomyces sp. NPDC001270 TaxID=3364554 RepID=UPI0036B6A360
MEKTPQHQQPVLPEKAEHNELIDLVFDGDFEEIHAPIREAVTDGLFSRREGLTMTEQGRLAYERTRLIHEHAGAAEGIIADPRRLFAVSEWPALMDTTALPLLTVHYNLCLATILQHGQDRDDLNDYIKELSTMSTVGMFMVTELGWGNNAAALQTQAVYDHATDEFIINTPNPQAQKFMPFSGIQDVPKLAVVMARLIVQGADCGVFPFVVRIVDENGLLPGVRATPLPEKPGFALDNGVTWFDHVRVPRRNFLGGTMGHITQRGEFVSEIRSRRRRFFTSLERVHAGRLCLSSALVSAGRASTYIAVRYSLRRHTSAPAQQDVPLLAYRSQQTALFRALADVYAMTFLINHVKREYLHSSGSNDTKQLIAIAKAVTSWTMTDVLTTCRERMGAQGMFSANRIADYISMAQGVVTAEGDNLPLLAKVGSELLANPEVHPKPSPHSRSLTDPLYHLELLCYRQGVVGQDTTRSMRQEIRRGSSVFAAWNHHINTAIDLAHSRGAVHAVQAFSEAVAGTHSLRAKRALRLLASIYALGLTSRHATWYVTHGVLTPSQANRIPRLIETLCARVLADAEFLIGGFALTDDFLGAPALSSDLSAFCAQPHDRTSPAAASAAKEWSTP